jgi:hypothetical protein
VRAEITGNWVLQYFFEILNAAAAGGLRRIR